MQYHRRASRDRGRVTRLGDLESRTQQVTLEPIGPGVRIAGQYYDRSADPLRCAGMQSGRSYDVWQVWHETSSVKRALTRSAARAAGCTRLDPGRRRY